MAGSPLSRMWIIRFTRLALGGVFVWAGIAKALEPSAFAAAIDNFRMVPHEAVVLLALYLPWLEIVAGIALICRKLYTGALAITTMMVLGFLVALGSALIRRLDITCGCFGGTGQHSILTSFTMDLILLLAVTILIFDSNHALEWRP